MPLILASDRGAVRVLTLHRPEVRNALNEELRLELAAKLEQAAAAPGVRALVLTGSGSAFCAGLDLAELASMRERNTEQHREEARALSELFLRIYRLPKPVVAAVNGPAVAGGAGLVSVCDLVIAGERARIGYTEVRIGFVAALVSVFLVRQIGERSARELLLGGELIGAAEALALGLVNEVVPDERLLERALERAEALTANAPTALALTKTLLAEVSGGELERALAAAAEINAAARSSADLHEGVQAFLDGRAPRWRSERGGDPA